MSITSSSRKPRCRDARQFRDLNISGIKTVALTSKARNTNPPGQHGTSRKKNSDYSIMLAEKQKVRLIYGNIKEYQFRKLFDRSAQMKGQTSLNLLQMLETRLSNVVYKAGFAVTLAEAKQLVSHGAFEVSVAGKPFHKVDCGSFQMKPGYVLQLRSKARSQNRILNAISAFQEQGQSTSWMNINHSEFRVEIVQLPERDQLPQNINENLIVELYSK